ncbi:alpha/beta hydrolase [Mycolicibacterium goodii]|uniref:alpha/beta hydrolase n=1 Tax=Mycolicibacterium goodii TaxID=134601 RepID=UPI001F033FD7|nr:alpha/beta hydrolase [Mycolicibacterium goodii]ULN46303.1 alpha/beta hydrolase [Mycolicibacterium goodii]
MTQPTLVWVPGACHGPWAFEEVSSRFTGLGWETRVVELPSVAPSSSARRGMHADAQAVRSVIESVGGPVVAIAHSYGGIPTTQGCAGLPNLRRIVYLAAFLLDEGHSMLSYSGEHFRWPIDGEVTMPPNPREAAYSDLSDSQAAWAIEQLLPVSVAAFDEALTAAAWRHVPSTYVICENDRSLLPWRQEKMAVQATEIRRLPTGHSPFLSHPAMLVNLVCDIVGE